MGMMGAGQATPGSSASAAASLMWSMLGGAHPTNRDDPTGHSSLPPSQWTPEMLSGMMPSLAQALRQAQTK